VDAFSVGEERDHLDWVLWSTVVIVKIGSVVKEVNRAFSVDVGTLYVRILNIILENTINFTVHINL
jgi:hypothetical protein